MKYNEIMKTIPHDTKVKDLPPIMACFNAQTHELSSIEMTREWENGKYLNVVLPTTNYIHFGTFTLDGEYCSLYKDSIYVDVRDYELDFKEFTCALNIE